MTLHMRTMAAGPACARIKLSRMLRPPRALVCALLLLAAHGCRRAPTIPHGRLFVSDERSHQVSVIDLPSGALHARIDVGGRPRAIRVGPDRRYVFVAVTASPLGDHGIRTEPAPPGAHSGRDGIDIIDPGSLRVVRTLPAGSDPESFDITPDGRFLYVSNEDSGTVTCIEVQSGRIAAQVPVGREPEGVSVRPDGREVFVACEGDDSVTVIDAATRAPIASIATGHRPRSVAFSPDGRRAWVTNENSATVSEIDVQARRVVATLPLQPAAGNVFPVRPMGAVVSHDGELLAVSNGRNGSVALIDLTHRQAVRTVPSVGARCWGLDVAREGQGLFVANGPSGDVAIIDVHTGNVVRRIAAGASPWGLAFVP